VSGEGRYRAIVEYDGTDFLGYQLQASGRTVQGEIEKSLQQVTQSAIRIDGAGRTDAGVHATGQVIAFNALWKHSLAELHRALNATLPDDIVISNLKIVDPTFHPRFDALSRSYRYTIMNQPWVSVLQRRYAYHVRKKLDVLVMQESSHLLIGSHDFASFGKPPQGENTIRQVSQAEWATNDNRLTFEITANAFLYHMVRTIVGTLIQVGLGQIAVNEIKDILAARDLTRSAPPAPAHGLCLVRVTYPAEC
jgi:tRNA pseudouridine38-40 synthase